MPTEYLPHDRQLKRGISLILNQDGGLINNVLFGLTSGLRALPIEFQFVPKIVSDSRKATWNEHELPNNDAFAAPVSTVGPRIMSMQWTYIVDEIGDVPSFNFGQLFKVANPDGIWTIEKIKRNINALRGYFLTAKTQEDSSFKGLVARLRWPLLGGIGEWTCRIVSVDVKHSENMVGNDRIMFPLRSDVSIDLRLWTTGYLGNNEDQKTQNVLGQKPLPQFTDLWY
jgi:hypothetical protein